MIRRLTLFRRSAAIALIVVFAVSCGGGTPTTAIDTFGQKGTHSFGDFIQFTVAQETVRQLSLCFNMSQLACPGWVGRRPVGQDIGVPLAGDSFQATFPFHPNYGGSTTIAGRWDRSRKEAAGSIQISYTLPADLPGNPQPVCSGFLTGTWTTRQAARGEESICQ